MSNQREHAVTLTLPEVRNMRDLALEAAKLVKEEDDRDRWMALGIRLDEIAKKIEVYERRYS
jgi:hypothetical protein